MSASPGDAPADKLGAPWPARSTPASLKSLLDSPPVREAARALIAAVAEEELEAGFTLLEKALERVAEERGLPC